MADTQLIARQLLSDLKRDFGLTNEQAAGVVGNLMHESGGFNSLQEINPTVPGSAGGFGFAQWTGPRRKSFDSYVKERGVDRNSYDANYGFLKHELENNRYERNQFNKVKKAGTAAEAARIVSENYLRPGIPHNASRVRYAEQVLPFAKMPVPPGELPSVGTALSTVPTPPATPMPPIPMSRPDPVERSFARLPQPTPANVSDQLALSPIRGAGVPSLNAGGYSGPAFNSSYARNDSPDYARSGAIPAKGALPQTILPPVPASPFERITARNTAPRPERVLLPEIPPSAMAKSPSASDMVRGRNGFQTIETVPTTGLGQPPATRTVQSVPMPPREAQPTYTRLAGRGFGEPAPAYVAPEVPPVTSLPSLPPLQGFDVANKDQSRLVAGVYPMAPGGIVPIPGMPGSIQAPGVMPPMPYARPQRQVRQMPPMPRQRPSFLSQQFAPQAMPQQQRSPLRVTINGGNVQQPRQMTPVQQFQSQGYSPSQAYDAANQAAVERAISNARDPEAARRLNSR